MTASELSVIVPLMAPTPWATTGIATDAHSNNPSTIPRLNSLARMIDSLSVTRFAERPVD
jgi:hypothetical protein